MHVTQRGPQSEEETENRCIYAGRDDVLRVKMRISCPVRKSFLKRQLNLHVPKHPLIEISPKTPK